MWEGQYSPLKTFLFLLEVQLCIIPNDLTTRYDPKYLLANIEIINTCIILKFRAFHEVPGVFHSLRPCWDLNLILF